MKSAAVRRNSRSSKVVLFERGILPSSPRMSNQHERVPRQVSQLDRIERCGRSRRAKACRERKKANARGHHLHGQVRLLLLDGGGEVWTLDDGEVDKLPGSNSRTQIRVEPKAGSTTLPPLSFLFESL
jgi:hypothetical protein